MNRNRLALHQALIEILGSEHVYFQPPSTVKMRYPCIVYERSAPIVGHANNRPYVKQPGYTVTVIDPDPDGDITARMEELPACQYDRHFTSGNLNHDVYTLYWRDMLTGKITLPVFTVNADGRLTVTEKTFDTDSDAVTGLTVPTFEIDDKGHLIVTAENYPLERFSINPDTGRLEYAE